MTRVITWTPARDAMLCDLRGRSTGRLTFAETARAMGIDERYIRQRCAELGLSTANRKPTAAETMAIATVPRPAGVQRREVQEYPRGVCGTAREAPTAASSGAATRDTVSTPPAKAVVASAARRRPPLIDLTRAPSTMEQVAARWAGR